MYKILECKESYLSTGCINKCIDFLRNINTVDNHAVIMEIKAKVTVEDIDILLLAYFILFKQERKNLTIRLNLTQNKRGDDNSLSSSLYWKLMQYQTQVSIVSGLQPFFAVSYGLDKDGRPTTSPEKYIQGRQVVISAKFMPLLYIDEGRYERIFGPPIIFTRIIEETDYNKSNDELDMICRGNLVTKIENDSVNAFGYFVELTFCELLSRLKILNFYLKPPLVQMDSLKASMLSNEESINYYKEVNNRLLNSLQHKAPIYIFIFNMLVDAMLPTTFNGGNVSQVLDNLFRLWEFTCEMVSGLDELAKNIIAHSSHKRGVISARIYTKDNLKRFYKIEESNKRYSDYFEFLIKKGIKYDKFLNINVIDDGKKGVVATLKEEQGEDEIEEGGGKALEKLRFKDFLHVEKLLTLDFQAKRAIAHLGLMFFSNLICSNYGIIHAGTWYGIREKFKYKRENVLLFNKSSCDEDSNVLPAMGTAYSLLVPLDINKKLDPYVRNKIDLPVGVTEEQILSIENLFLYKIHDCSENEPLKEEANGAYILKVTIPSSKRKIRERDEETQLWDCFFKQISGFEEMLNSRKAVVCFDVEDILWNESVLFRFLGRWELEFATIPLILYNLPMEIFLKLQNMNEIYTGGGERLPYWNPDSLVVVYSYIAGNEMMDRFYFTDVLWGKTKADFINLNYSLGRTHFNSVKLLNPERKEMDLKLLEKVGKFGVFHTRTNLFSFELLLETPEGLSLFEQNILLLGQNELIINA